MHIYMEIMICWSRALVLPTKSLVRLDKVANPSVRPLLLAYQLLQCNIVLLVLLLLDSTYQRTAQYSISPRVTCIIIMISPGVRRQAALPQGIVPFVFAKEYNVHPAILSTM